jgi:hypothetical protein
MPSASRADLGLAVSLGTPGQWSPQDRRVGPRWGALGASGHPDHSDPLRDTPDEADAEIILPLLVDLDRRRLHGVPGGRAKHDKGMQIVRGSKRHGNILIK